VLAADADGIGDGEVVLRLRPVPRQGLARPDRQRRPVRRDRLLQVVGAITADAVLIGVAEYLTSPESDARMPEWLGAIDDLGAGLWGLFGQALDRSLKEHGVKEGARLVWLPTDALGLLPASLAQDKASGRRLGETYEIVYAPSLEALAAAARRLANPPAPSLAAAINPTGEIADLALPFTEIEGDLVAAAHFAAKARIKLDKSTATPDLVLAALKDKSYWHISSHGRFDWEDVRQSGLVMRGQAMLTLGRLLETEGSLGHPRLVALSACETGLYDINRNANEFIGLPATLMQIGATGVLSSLWPVDDLATALLMAKFYDLHLDQGLAPPAALKSAQDWLRGATKAELMRYGKEEAAKAKLDPTKLATLEGSLMVRSRAAGSRFASISEILQKWGAGKAASGQSVATEEQDLQSHPFEHPYNWGGFVYTGL
jgi:CHAT domain-containing protein